MSLTAAFQAIDAANASDPNRFDGRPLAQVQGELASAWVDTLDVGSAAATDAVRIAARAHHLRRWEVPRSEYPTGRTGYLRWRSDAKRRHAAMVDDLLTPLGYSPEVRDRVGALLQRQGLGVDAGTQLVEDAACLVFLETQLDDLVGRVDREDMTADKLVSVVAKTMLKMSEAALAAARALPLSARAAAVLAAATAG